MFYLIIVFYLIIESVLLAITNQPHLASVVIIVHIYACCFIQKQYGCKVSPSLTPFLVLDYSTSGALAVAVD